MITNLKNRENKDFVELVFLGRKCENRSFAAETAFLVFEN